MDKNQENKSKEDMIKEAVEEAKKASVDEECSCEGDCTCEEGCTCGQEEASEEETSSEEEVVNEEDQASLDEKEEKKEKKFGRKNKKDKRDEKIEELTDRLTRQIAEFDNFRKRTEKEKSQMYEIGAKDVIDKVLPVVDNFERGLQAVTEEEKENPFMQGMDKVYKQLMTTLEEIGVKPIEAVGTEFNPEFHNAVMHVEDEEFGESVITEEFQKGYRYRESVVRHSMVKVAN